jgi:hypothetical protein
MSALPPLITPNDAQQRLQDDGLLALGLTAPLLSPAWSGADPTYDSTALTLTMASGGVRPAFRAIRTWVADLRIAGVYDVSGLPPIGVGAVLRLHPQAAARLENLVSWRLGAAGPIRPVPHTMVVRCQTNKAVTPQWFSAGDILDIDPADTPVVSFHDARGLIIDPVAVAALITDLAGALPALAPMPMLNAVGGVAHIAAKATGVTVQVVDPHGAPFRAVDSLAPIVVDGSGGKVDDVPDSGIVSLAAGQGVAPPQGADAAARIRVGWARNGTLDRAALYPPALGAATLGRQFLRVSAVDLKWHLLGNRSDATKHGVGPADQDIPSDFRPAVRDRVRLDYLVDGVDVLAAGGQALAAIGAGWTGLAFASSPTLDAAVGVPPAPAAGGHWPAFPVAVGGAVPQTGQPDTGLVASWSGDQDVLLTFPGGTIPIDWHVRIYPQVFQTITSIGPTPSFLRGDGAAAVVVANTAFSVLLKDPLRLPDGVSQPSGETLVFDLVVTDRAGASMTFGDVIVPIGAGGAPPAPVDQFGAPDPLGGIAAGAMLRAVAPAPVYGIPAPPPANTNPPGGIIEMLRRLGGESDPRVGPRLPTQARFPTVVAIGTGPTSAPMAWDAVVSGGRWGRETRSAEHVGGNPGNPAGPDVHASGVRIDGAAAFDAAQLALRRVQPLLPFVSTVGIGWIPIVANTGWVAPAEPGNDAAPPGQAPRTCAAAVLHTVAVKCESPELALFNDIPDANADPQDLMDAIANKLGVPPPSLSFTNWPQVLHEIRREFYVNRFGARDAQWALRRAVRHARDLVFVSSPQFSATSHPKDPPATPAPHEVDLVAELAGRMAEQPSLLVLICVPRWPDASPAYGGWVRQSFAARNDALDALKDVDANRVVAFHPNGFPGRPVAIRSTTVIVDDAWALVGTSHWRRRGMTFDDGVDVVGFDRATDNGGASRRIRVFRQALLAALTGVRPPTAPATDADWSRLAGTRSCVDLVADLVAQGGLGRLAPFWEGPTDTDVLPQSVHVADPDGGTSDEYLLRFASLIGESPS